MNSLLQMTNSGLANSEQREGLGSWDRERDNKKLSLQKFKLNEDKKQEPTFKMQRESRDNWKRMSRDERRIFSSKDQVYVDSKSQDGQKFRTIDSFKGTEMKSETA